LCHGHILSSVKAVLPLSVMRERRLPIRHRAPGVLEVEVLHRAKVLARGRWRSVLIQTTALIKTLVSFLIIACGRRDSGSSIFSFTVISSAMGKRHALRAGKGYGFRVLSRLVMLMCPQIFYLGLSSSIFRKGLLLKFFGLWYPSSLNACLLDLKLEV